MSIHVLYKIFTLQWFLLWSWSIPAAFHLYKSTATVYCCFWIEEISEKSCTCTVELHECMILFQPEGASSGVEVSPHSVKPVMVWYQMTKCDIEQHYMLQYCSIHDQELKVARLLLEWPLIILPSEHTWYDTVLHDIIWQHSSHSGCLCLLFLCTVFLS